MISSVSAANYYAPTPLKSAAEQAASSTTSKQTDPQTATVSATQDPDDIGRQTLAPASEGQEADNEQQEKQEQQESEQLSQRDRQVRAHEAAHQGAAGGLGGAAHFEYQTGPDGKRYAVGGEVPIDVSKVAGDPQATILKANRIRNAALAPADPSAQDRAVAAKASALAAEATQELHQDNSQQEPANPLSGEKSAAAANGDNSVSGKNSNLADPQQAADEQAPSPARVEHHAITAYQAHASEQDSALHLVA